MKLLYFSSNTCGPCRMMKPIIKGVEAKTDIEVVKYTAEENSDEFQKHNVVNVPTIIILKQDGTTVDTLVGIQQQQTLIDIIENS